MENNFAVDWTTLTEDDLRNQLGLLLTENYDLTNQQKLRNWLLRKDIDELKNYAQAIENNSLKESKINRIIKSCGKPDKWNTYKKNIKNIYASKNYKGLNKHVWNRLKKRFQRWGVDVPKWDGAVVDFPYEWKNIHVYGNKEDNTYSAGDSLIFKDQNVMVDLGKAGTYDINEFNASLPNEKIQVVGFGEDAYKGRNKIRKLNGNKYDWNDNRIIYDINVGDYLKADKCEFCYPGKKDWELLGQWPKGVDYDGKELYFKRKGKYLLRNGNNKKIVNVGDPIKLARLQNDLVVDEMNIPGVVKFQEDVYLTDDKWNSETALEKNGEDIHFNVNEAGVYNFRSKNNPNSRYTLNAKDHNRVRIKEGVEMITTYQNQPINFVGNMVSLNGNGVNFPLKKDFNETVIFQNPGDYEFNDNISNFKCHIKVLPTWKNSGHNINNLLPNIGIDYNFHFLSHLKGHLKRHFALQILEKQYLGQNLLNRCDLLHSGSHNDWEHIHNIVNHKGLSKAHKLRSLLRENKILRKPLTEFIVDKLPAEYAQLKQVDTNNLADMIANAMDNNGDLNVNQLTQPLQNLTQAPLQNLNQTLQNLVKPPVY